MSTQRIAAVVVTFHPDSNFLERLATLFAQVQGIVVVDNTPGASTEELLTKLKNKGCQIIKNDKNRGVAAALNQGISWAAQQKYSWVLTLDQDTITHPGLVDLYTCALTQQLPLEKIGVLNTVYRETSDGKIGFTLTGKKTNKWMNVEAMITSGSFFSIDTFNKAGSFREGFFLDWADHEFCLRVRAKGLENYIFTEPYFDHALGKKQTHRLLGVISVTTNNHPPFRCYWIGRNLTILLKEYFLKEFRWASFHFLYLWAKLLLILVFENDKKAKLHNYLGGIGDGLFDRPINPRTNQKS